MDELYEESEEDLRREAERIYGEHPAYCHITDRISATGAPGAGASGNGRIVTDIQALRVSFFCQKDLRIRIIDNGEPDYKLYRQMVHEFVHAQLYAIMVLGPEDVELPYEDHDDAFYKEEESLLGELTRALAAKDDG